MKLIFLFIAINFSLSLLVFPFKVRENYAKRFSSPINKTEISIIKYLYHILNDYEFVSEIEVGNPKQKVGLLFNFNDNYLTLLGHSSSRNPYYYNLSSSYKELIINDKNCGLKIAKSTTIKEILHMKNKFYDNLNKFISSKEEISHEFVILFEKHLPTLKPIVSDKYPDSNTVNIGLLWNSNYKGENGIYNPFLNEVKEHGFIENYVHFLYFFDDYEENLYIKDKDIAYDGLIVFGKYPHEIMPDKYDIKNLFWTNTFLQHHRFCDNEDIIWGFKFNQVYIDYGNNKKQQFEFLRGVFDLNVEYIFPPYIYYETIKNFFRPLRKICFIDSNDRLYHKDDNIYRMVYCDYEEFGKKYLKTFPKLIFKIDDFEEEFEFTYKDLFKPVYDNKYYLFLIFTGRFWRATELIIQPLSYPWTLGRIFFKKYKFVFDSMNKKIGYYRDKSIKNNKEDTEDTTDNTNNYKAFNKVNDTIEETNIIKNKKEDNNNKKNDDIKEVNSNNNKINENNNINVKEIRNINKETNYNKITDIIFIVIFVIILSIIMVIVIGVCYECWTNRKPRKKRINELIDEQEYIPQEE